MRCQFSLFNILICIFNSASYLREHLGVLHAEISSFIIINDRSTLLIIINRTVRLRVSGMIYYENNCNDFWLCVINHQLAAFAQVVNGWYSENVSFDHEWSNRLCSCIFLVNCNQMNFNSTYLIALTNVFPGPISHSYWFRTLDMYSIYFNRYPIRNVVITCMIGPVGHCLQCYVITTFCMGHIKETALNAGKFQNSLWELRAHICVFKQQA